MSPRRSRCSNSPGRCSTHSQCRYRYSLTPYHINSITTEVQQPNIASYSIDTKDKPVQVNQCKNRCPTPLPSKLFTFPTFSGAEEPVSTGNELLLSETLSETESSTSYTLQPEDTDFSPFQDHTRCLQRPSCILVPIKQLLKSCSTQSMQIKDTTFVFYWCSHRYGSQKFNRIRILVYLYIFLI